MGGPPAMSCLVMVTGRYLVSVTVIPDTARRKSSLPLPR